MKVHTPYELAGGMAEIEKQPDRAAAIIATTLLEHNLVIAIQHRLLPLPRALKDNLFGSRGTLGAFQDKIDLGFALGLYTKAGHHDFDTIRKVRNRFAHTPIALTFQDAEIKKLCSSLLLGGEHLLTPKQKEPRERFLIAWLTGWSLLHFLPKKNIRLQHVSLSHPALGREISAAIYGASPGKP
jgi:hypothetical protein